MRDGAKYPRDQLETMKNVRGNNKKRGKMCKTAYFLTVPGHFSAFWGIFYYFRGIFDRSGGYFPGRGRRDPARGDASGAYADRMRTDLHTVSGPYGVFVRPMCGPCATGATCARCFPGPLNVLHTIAKMLPEPPGAGATIRSDPAHVLTD